MRRIQFRHPEVTVCFAYLCIMGWQQPATQNGTGFHAPLGNQKTSQKTLKGITLTCIHGKKAYSLKLKLH
jgi:hypothetical protein